LIGFNPHDRSSGEVPCFYRIDPSGAVTTLGQCAVIHGELGTTDVRERLQQVAAEQEMEQAFKKRQSGDVIMTKRLPILTAKAFEGRYSVHRHFNN
jgi:hypothetical protein